jgi:hypothetical protein
MISLLHQAKILGDEKHRARAPLRAFIEELLHLKKDTDLVRTGTTAIPGALGASRARI